jgi:hypothetical protein
MINSRKLVKSNKLDIVKDDFNNAQRFYLLNKKKIQADDLARLLPTLEQKIDKEATLTQFNSFYLFLTLCFRYQENLPDSFSEFKNSNVLANKFLNLKTSSLFKVQTTRGDKNFVENAIKKLMLVSKFAEGVSLEKLEDLTKNKKELEEKPKAFSSTEKDLLSVFFKASDKPILLTDKSLEKYQEELAKKKTEKSPTLLNSQLTVFGKKRKLEEAETANQSLIKTNQSLCQLDPSTISPSKLTALVSQ